jgi:dipeptidyl aminopeptidase/acylaminoacyl peptidase
MTVSRRYHVLKSLGRETQLVVGASHSVDKPSHRRDRMERYLGWYGKYLGVVGAPAAAR